MNTEGMGDAPLAAAASRTQTQRAPLRTSCLGRAAPRLSCWSFAVPTIAAHGDARQSAHE
jgi:hypothetical protein